MRNLILLAHVSLDGFMAGPGGDMSFITMNAEIGDHVYPLTTRVGTGVYGRVTYEMMEGYWPAIARSGEPGSHERQHAEWYLGVDKIVGSRTLRSADPTVQIVGDDLPGAVAAAKRRPGGDLMIFGSPSIARLLGAHDLIDEWRLFIQPVVVGGGIPAFATADGPARLALQSTHAFRSGVIAAHYTRRPA